MVGSPWLPIRVKPRLTGFSSVDKAKANDFLKWDSFYLNGIDAGLNPFHLNIREIALTDFYSRLIINSDGTLNVQDVLKDEKEEQQENMQDALKDEKEEQQEYVQDALKDEKEEQQEYDPRKGDDNYMPEYRDTLEKQIQIEEGNTSGRDQSIF